MPITANRIGRRAKAPQAIPALFALFLAALAGAAGGRFSVVLDGRIVSVEAIDGGKSGTLVHARALAEMAAHVGAAVSTDPAGGIVSVTRAGPGAGGDPVLAGFKGGVTLVVEGKILKVTSRAPKGVPYIAARDLQRAAAALGLEADLDVSAGVLALSGGRVDGGPSRPRAAVDPVGSDLLSVVANAAGGTGLGGGGVAPPHDGSVCGYLDSQKALWLATEPSHAEKETVRRLADEFERAAKARRPGNLADLELFERTLRGFDQKVRSRLEGTRDSTPPAGAREWHSTAVEFLERTAATLDLVFDLIRVMKLPPGEQDKELPAFRKGVERLKKLDAEHRALGTRANERIVDVRTRNGCGPA